MAQTPVKFGILSTASIAHIIADAIKTIPEAECVAVASRDLRRAKTFAERHDIAHACLYNELLTLPIDAVYIPLPTSMCTHWAILFAKAGKHVLVDKPLGSTTAARDMLEACKNANVVFLDGTHFVHSARTKEVQKRISVGDIGTIRRIEASFSFPISRVAKDIRSDVRLEPQGFLGDLGWYCARNAVTYLGTDVTSRMMSVTCTASFHPQFPECVQRGSGVIEFGTEGNSVNLCYSFDSACNLNQRVAIIGDLGTFEISDFVVPLRHAAVFKSIRPPEMFSTDTEYIYERAISRIEDGDSFQLVFPFRDQTVVKEPNNLTQPEAMIQEFCRLIQTDDKRGATLWAKETLATQAILDAMMAKVE